MNESAYPKVIKRVRSTIRSTPTSEVDVELARENIRQILETNCRLLCDRSLAPEIHITFDLGDKTCVFFVDCPQPALGKILGSGGKNINALRILANAMSANVGFRSIIEVVYHEARR